MPQSFLERLQHHPVLGDGAMGTQLYARAGVSFERCLEELNRSNPDLVKGVHLDYLRAGAEIIETNTFGANRVRLAAHGLQDAVEEINRQGVAIAREARRLTGQQVWVAGAVGPLGKRLVPLGPIAQAQARAAFRQQASALAAAGADLIMLETFSDLQELREAVLAAREACSLPLIAQMTLNEEGRTAEGVTPLEIVQALEELGVEVIGLNCSVGSQPMLEAVLEMAQAAHTPLCAQPNAGFPAYIGGRFVYRSSPEYMAEHARHMVEAGVAVIGGCCGTTPEHIARMRDALQGVRRGGRPPAGTLTLQPRVPREVPAPAPVGPTGLQEKLGKKFIVTVEADPPRGFDLSRTLLEVGQLRASGLVDAINVADSPRAQGRMSALATCSLLQSRLGVETVMHLATRHRNLVALHSELLGAHALGVRNIFVVMGDLPRIGDYPDATAFSDVTASRLIRLIKGFNQGRDLAGKPLEQPTAFFVGCAFNLAAPDPDRELRALERKVEAGADFILTQPVYSAETVEQWWRRLGGFPRPVLLGLLPLRSHRHAEFLHHEVPGIFVPPEVRQRLQEAGEGATELGMSLARELLQAVHGRVAGVYLILPAGRYEAVGPLLQGLA
jgi:homocysteine S-methyltransferase